MGTTPSHIRSERDPALSATVVSCTPLLYAQGADSGLDRPAHVRAGSSLVWFGDRLAAIQDDANFVALIDPASLQVEAIPLPADEYGKRQFDETRGTKHRKLDLEACAVVPTPSGSVLLALGSGSTPARERLLLTSDLSPPLSLTRAASLYAHLRETVAFSGSEINIEGAVFVEGMLRLFNRGNGAPRGELQPVDATGDLPWSDLEAYLREPDERRPPRVRNVVQYELGTLEGLRLSFTDAAPTPHGLMYSAAAEDSPDAVQDGEVTGSAVGVLREGGTARWIELRERDGSLFRAKVEGLCPSRAHPDRLYVLVDADDPEQPSLFCEVELSGGW